MWKIILKLCTFKVQDWRKLWINPEHLLAGIAGTVMALPLMKKLSGKMQILWQNTLKNMAGNILLLIYSGMSLLPETTNTIISRNFAWMNIQGLYQQKTASLLLPGAKVLQNLLHMYTHLVLSLEYILCVVSHARRYMLIPKLKEARKLHVKLPKCQASVHGILICTALTLQKKVQRNITTAFLNYTHHGVWIL